MEILALIVIAGLIYFYVSNNSRKVKDETVITTTQTVKTAHGEQTITRTTTINDVQTDIRNPQTPMYFKEHPVVQPHPQTQVETQSKLPEQSVQNRIQEQPKQLTQKQEVKFKLCTGCNRTQPISEFGLNHNQPDGFTKWCKTCMKTGAPRPSDMSGKKVCEKCGQNRLKTSFYPTTKYPDGLSKWCKFCLPQKKK